MMISPRRLGLESVLAFSATSQFILKDGSTIFGFNGEPTPEYRQLVEQFFPAVETLCQQAQTIRDELFLLQEKL